MSNFLDVLKGQLIYLKEEPKEWKKESFRDGIDKMDKVEKKPENIFLPPLPPWKGRKCGIV